MKLDIAQATEQFLIDETVDTPINELWLKFKEIITTAQENHVPSKTSSKRYTQRWFNRSCRRIVQKNQGLFHKYKHTKEPCNWNK